MKISPQDIIDKEFRVKFRGFDMAQVDAFLEEVAENFFRLAEENTLLNEKVLALQKELESGPRIAPQAQLEMSPELVNGLEELKHDTMAIGAELTSLKQDRQLFTALEKSVQQGFASLQDSLAKTIPQKQLEIPVDLDKVMQDFKQANDTIRAELAALKEDRQAFATLKANLEAVIAATQEAAAPLAAPAQAEIPAELGNALQDFKLANDTISAELGALKKEIGTMIRFREEIKGELQGLFKTQLEELEAKIPRLGTATVHPPPAAKAAPSPKKPAATVVAPLAEEAEELEEDTRLPDSEEQDEGSEDSELEFLSEDDLLDVDKLRGIFQSVLDDSISDAHDSRADEADSGSDLLFLDDDLVAVEHEPEVTFSLEEKKTEKKLKPKRA